MDDGQHMLKVEARCLSGRPRGALSRWGRLIVCLLAVWVFVFEIAPRIQRLGPVRVVHDAVREHDIDATGLYYTDVPEFSDADGAIRDALTY